MIKIIKSISFFLRQSYFAYKALFGWRQPSDYLIMKILEPATEIMFFSMLGLFAGKDPTYFALGNSIRLASVSGIFGCASVILNERRSGTLPSVIASPTKSIYTFFARSFLQGLDGLVTIAIGLLLSCWFFDLDFSHVNWAWFFLTLLITSYSVSSFGMLLATWGLVSSDLNLIMNMAYSGLILLCGVNYPIESLPPMVQLISRVLPLTHGLEAVRFIFNGNLTDLPILLMKEAIAGIFYALLAYFLFRSVELMARQKGTLDLI